MSIVYTLLIKYLLGESCLLFTHQEIREKELGKLVPLEHHIWSANKLQELSFLIFIEDEIRPVILRNWHLSGK